MVHPSIIKWVEECITLGHEIGTIKNKLFVNGYNPGIVDDVLQDLERIEEVHKNTPRHVLRWIERVIADGYEIEKVKESLRKAGHDPKVADKILEELIKLEHLKKAPENVVKWVEEAISNGHDIHAIKKKLRHHGYDHTIADEIKKKHFEKNLHGERIKHEYTFFKGLISSKFPLIFIGAVILFVVGTFFIYNLQLHSGPQISEVIDLKTLESSTASMTAEGYTLNDQGYTLKKVNLTKGEYTIKITAKAQYGFLPYKYEQKNGEYYKVNYTGEEINNIVANKNRDYWPYVFVNLEGDYSSQYVNSEDWKVYVYQINLTKEIKELRVGFSNGLNLEKEWSYWPYKRNLLIKNIEIQSS